MPEKQKRNNAKPVAAIVNGTIQAYPFVLTALMVVQFLLPQRSGPLALLQAFALFLFAPALVLVPAALRRGSAGRLPRFSLLLVAFLFLLRFPPTLGTNGPFASIAHSETISSSQAGGHSSAEQRLSVLSWNVEMGGQPDKVLEVLRSRPADIVGLTESDASYVDSDPRVTALYPYRWRIESKEDRAYGVLLLSTYPLGETGAGIPSSTGTGKYMRSVWARVQVPGPTGSTPAGADAANGNLLVIVAHPSTPTTCGERTGTGRMWGLLTNNDCYNTDWRDSENRLINAFATEQAAHGVSVLVVGDFNLTEREPGYGELTRGMVDVFREYGSGLGNTWPHGTLGDAGLLRIDYQFAGPGVQPLSIRTDCTERGSDHCMLFGEYLVSGK